MLNEIKSAVAYYYRERYDTLIFFCLMCAAWFLMVPHLEGLLRTLVTVVWVIAMWYGATHASRLENAGRLNRDRSNWKV